MKLEDEIRRAMRSSVEDLFDRAPFDPEHAAMPPLGDEAVPAQIWQGLRFLADYVEALEGRVAHLERAMYGEAPTS